MIIVAALLSADSTAATKTKNRKNEEDGSEEKSKLATQHALRELDRVTHISCAAGLAWLRQSGAAVAANDVRSTEWRTATAVTPSR